MALFDELRSRSQNTSPIQDLFSLVGWGRRGEDEETGAILKVCEALGIFYFDIEIQTIQ